MLDRSRKLRDSSYAGGIRLFFFKCPIQIHFIYSVLFYLTVSKGLRYVGISILCALRDNDRNIEFRTFRVEYRILGFLDASRGLMFPAVIVQCGRYRVWSLVPKINVFKTPIEEEPLLTHLGWGNRGPDHRAVACSSVYRDRRYTTVQIGGFRWFATDMNCRKRQKNRSRHVLVLLFSIYLFAYAKCSFLKKEYYTICFTEKQTSKIITGKIKFFFYSYLTCNLVFFLQCYLAQFVYEYMK